MMGNPKYVLIIAALLMAGAVGAGAFGAHALKSMLSPERLETWKTAVQYHAWHALALILIASLSYVLSLDIRWISTLLLTGIVFFSGSLYALCLTDTSWLGAITPIGGVAFIAGWLLFAYKLLFSLTE